MRVGLVIPNTWPDAVESVGTLGVAAEEWGYDSVWVTDHVVGVRSFAPVYGPVWLEPLASLAFLAGVTSTVRIGVSVMVVPYRDPVYAAKVLTTIDQLSGGRLDVGVAVGWSRAEYHALGKGHLFDARGKVTNEALRLVRRCWEGGELGFEGEHFEVRRIEFAPVPRQRPHPPLWVGGGTSRATLARIAEFADVWHPANQLPATVAEIGKAVDERAGRAVPRGPRVAVPHDALDSVPDLVAEFAEQGCVEVVLEFRDRNEPTTADATRRSAEHVAERLQLAGRR